MGERRYNLAQIILMICFLMTAFAVSVYAAISMNSKTGTVGTPSRPSNLEGKTVLLRWNGKYNGDKFLSCIVELMTKQVKNVKVIKMWEKDSGTAVISRKIEISEQIASEIAKLRPDIVISSQGDCGMCTSWLVVDQLNLEKKGIPTVTIVTSAFEELARTAMKNQGVSEMSFVVIEHPLAGRNLKETRKLAEKYFQDILNAATQWKPKERPRVNGWEKGCRITNEPG